MTLGQQWSWRSPQELHYEEDAIQIEFRTTEAQRRLNSRSFWEISIKNTGLTKPKYPWITEMILKVQNSLRQTLLLNTMLKSEESNFKSDPLSHDWQDRVQHGKIRTINQFLFYCFLFQFYFASQKALLSISIWHRVNTLRNKYEVFTWNKREAKIPISAFMSSK